MSLVPFDFSTAFEFHTASDTKFDAIARFASKNNFHFEPNMGIDGYIEFLLLWVIYRFTKRALRAESIFAKAKAVLLFTKVVLGFKVTPMLEAEFLNSTRKICRYVQMEGMTGPRKQAKLLTFRRATRIIRRFLLTYGF